MQPAAAATSTAAILDCPLAIAVASSQQHNKHLDMKSNYIPHRPRKRRCFLSKINIMLQTEN